MNVSELASHFGYSSIHYFSRQFKNETGMSDSMVLGEPQILGQMKTAARVAQDSNMLSGRLDRAIDKQKVRSW